MRCSLKTWASRLGTPSLPAENACVEQKKHLHFNHHEETVYITHTATPPAHTHLGTHSASVRLVVRKFQRLEHLVNAHSRQLGDGTVLVATHALGVVGAERGNASASSGLERAGAALLGTGLGRSLDLCWGRGLLGGEEGGALGLLGRCLGLFGPLSVGLGRALGWEKSVGRGGESGGAKKRRRDAYRQPSSSRPPWPPSAC